jgi:hypothetical protein
MCLCKQTMRVVQVSVRLSGIKPFGRLKVVWTNNKGGAGECEIVGLKLLGRLTVVWTDDEGDASDEVGG